MGTEADAILLKAFLTEAYTVLGEEGNPRSMAVSLVDQMTRGEDSVTVVRSVTRTCDLMQHRSQEWANRSNAIRALLAQYVASHNKPVEAPECELTGPEEELWTRYTSHWEETETTGEREGARMSAALDAVVEQSKRDPGRTYAEMLAAYPCHHKASPWDEEEPCYDI